MQKSKWTMNECPCCPKGKAKLEDFTIAFRRGYRVKCASCGLQTDLAKSAQVAVKKWNRRNGKYGIKGRDEEDPETVFVKVGILNGWWAGLFNGCPITGGKEFCGGSYKRVKIVDGVAAFSAVTEDMGMLTHIGMFDGPEGNLMVSVKLNHPIKVVRSNEVVWKTPLELAIRKENL